MATNSGSALLCRYICACVIPEPFAFVSTLNFLELCISQRVMFSSLSFCVSTHSLTSAASLSVATLDKV